MKQVILKMDQFGNSFGVVSSLDITEFLLALFKLLTSPLACGIVMTCLHEGLKLQSFLSIYFITTWYYF